MLSTEIAPVKHAESKGEQKIICSGSFLTEGEIYFIVYKSGVLQL